MIKHLNWKEVEARAKEMTDYILVYSYMDCLDCIKQGVPNEGYYYDEASVYWREMYKRKLTVDFKLGEIKWIH